MNRARTIRFADSQLRWVYGFALAKLLYRGQWYDLGACADLVKADLAREFDETRFRPNLLSQHNEQNPVSLGSVEEYRIVTAAELPRLGAGEHVVFGCNIVDAPVLVVDGVAMSPAKLYDAGSLRLSSCGLRLGAPLEGDEPWTDNTGAEYALFVGEISFVGVPHVKNQVPASDMRGLQLQEGPMTVEERLAALEAAVAALSTNPTPSPAAMAEGLPGLRAAVDAYAADHGIDAAAAADEICVTVGCDAAEFASWLDGSATPDSATLDLLATTLGVSADQLTAAGPPASTAPSPAPVETQMSDKQNASALRLAEVNARVSALEAKQSKADAVAFVDRVTDGKLISDDGRNELVALRLQGVAEDRIAKLADGYPASPVPTRRMSPGKDPKVAAPTYAEMDSAGRLKAQRAYAEKHSVKLHEAHNALFRGASV